jgi:hypothetical protein
LAETLGKALNTNNPQSHDARNLFVGLAQNFFDLADFSDPLFSDHPYIGFGMAHYVAQGLSLLGEHAVLARGIAKHSTKLAGYAVKGNDYNHTVYEFLDSFGHWALDARGRDLVASTDLLGLAVQLSTTERKRDFWAREAVDQIRLLDTPYAQYPVQLAQCYGWGTHQMTCDGARDRADKLVDFAAVRGQLGDFDSLVDCVDCLTTRYDVVIPDRLLKLLEIVESSAVSKDKGPRVQDLWQKMLIKRCHDDLVQRIAKQDPERLSKKMALEIDIDPEVSLEATLARYNERFREDLGLPVVGSLPMPPTGLTLPLVDGLRLWPAIGEAAAPR